MSKYVGKVIPALLAAIVFALWAAWYWLGATWIEVTNLSPTTLTGVTVIVVDLASPRPRLRAVGSIAPGRTVCLRDGVQDGSITLSATHATRTVTQTDTVDLGNGETWRFLVQSDGIVQSGYGFGRAGSAPIGGK